MQLIAGFEFLPILLGPGNSLLQVLTEALLEPIVRHLLQQNRRQACRNGRPTSQLVDFADHVQNGQIGLGGGLIQPVFAVRPIAVVQHVRQVPMENQTEAAQGVTHRKSFPYRRLRAQLAQTTMTDPPPSRASK